MYYINIHIKHKYISLYICKNQKEAMNLRERKRESEQEVCMGGVEGMMGKNDAIIYNFKK